MRPRHPSAEELQRAVSASLPDIVGANLRVLFCGINPGLYSAAVGHHFARPGNRFWPVLHRSGFTPRRFDPSEDARLPELGLGLTNLVARATARADTLAPNELHAAFAVLEDKVSRLRPQYLAVLGIGAYRTAFANPKARIGRQTTTLGDTAVWVLPNPSGLNAHYRIEALTTHFSALRKAAHQG